MPGDTKIKKTYWGWIDVDDPTPIYNTRRLARDARRLRLNPQSWTTTVSHQTTVYDPPLSGLDARLYDRLTNKQGVSRDDALSVIRSNGYNAAASYGHMRAAGATHEEALSVIALANPAVSLGYGQARGRGDDHADALRWALFLDDITDDGDVSS